MTSPSCDWAYSLIPTVAVSPSRLTHSWVSANRIPLRSGIASPFVSFRMSPLVEGQRNPLGRRGRAANVDANTRAGLGQGRRQVGHPDVVAEGKGDVAGRHTPDALAILDGGIAVTGDTAIQHLEADQQPREPLLAGANDGITPDEVLVEAQRPVEPRFERIGMRVHIVAVETHAGFQPQGVTG